MYSFENKVVWVTGSSTGIGRAAAVSFARHGATVVIHGNSSIDELERLRDELLEQGSSCLVVRGDVGDRAQVERMVAQIQEAYGQLDVLVNNAGALIQRTRLEDLEEELWDRVMNVNLKSVYLVTKAALPLLKRAGKARIINVTSIAARNGGGFGSIAYGAAKGGVSTMTRGMAKDLIEYGITVNAISPGVIATPFHDRFTPPPIREKTLSTIPMGREGTPEEAVGAALFLASEYADYITGEIIEVNGGQLMD
ncbi:SDR family NAD(P)-dependent oxidoreductase [Paenibacillus cremeus]|uniref:3-oxoacyl-ACP reductase FabG n=1 Tax=Paenibacillus cremeus TaxID=2163881 RepID=A0A559JZR1_9BACL|nr:3-oxoacyl-ACP reductase family protein [Paenibacillus cremeus]TVY05385.1 3-oxoacyl-ACP reductase FabG [Paenibacillus cremeus]